MWHKVRDLSSEQRVAIESLLGRVLLDEEALNIQPSRVLAEAPVGEARARAYQQYLGHLDELAERANDVPDNELDALVDEALDRTRHSPS